MAVEQKRIQRRNASSRNTKTEFSTPKALEIAKRVIRQRTVIKRICNSEVRVFKYMAKHSEYFITYNGRVFELQ